MIELKERTEHHVRIYFEKTRDPEIAAMIPQSADTLERALADYRKSQMPGASSYGRTIYFDGMYIGDIWCYCIDEHDTPNAMISYCIFEKSLWNRGAATEALARFSEEIAAKFPLKTIGAFAYCQNTASWKVLEKNGFSQIETFSENGILSAYYQKTI